MMGGAINPSQESQWWNYFVDDFGNYSYNGTDNEYEGDVCDLEESSAFEALFIPILYSVAFAVGVLGNGLLLGVLFQSRKRWSVTDTFILHLAISDILLLLTLPLWAAQAISKTGWEFGLNLCKITGTVFTINFYCGIFLLACISIDRYLSIVHATQMYTRRKPWMVHMSCLVVWLFSVLLSVPDLIFLKNQMNDRSNRKSCVRQMSLSEKMSVRWLYHIVGFLLPSAILTFCYSSILLQLQCASQSIQKQRAFKVIIVVVAAFFLCWTPYNIVLLCSTIQHNNSISSSCDTQTSLDKALTVTSSLGYLHSSLNPILYAFVGVKFRRQLINILKSLGCKLKMSMKAGSTSRRSSIWSNSGETSNSIAI